ncbi:MAG: phosphoglucomutase/phosphomannomutase family protein, partial [Chloroflexota bacterium]|nr:phosphoglucomutase/phosphomannomutase family protein [Chloroflexota bacterium]
PCDLAGAPVVAVDTVDGIRYRLEGGEWAVVRFSGTEPLLRIYAEAPSTDRVRQLLEATRALTGV